MTAWQRVTVFLFWPLIVAGAIGFVLAAGAALWIAMPFYEMPWETRKRTMSDERYCETDLRQWRTVDPRRDRSRMALVQRLRRLACRAWDVRTGFLQLRMSQPDYADLCERYASMGLSGSDAAHYAGCGVRPDFAEDEDEPETEEETTE